MIKKFENYKDIDPYGEENWDDKKPNYADIPEGYYHVEMVMDYALTIEYGFYDEEDYYIEQYRSTLELEQGDDIWIDIIGNEGENVYITVDTGDEYHGRGILAKNSFVIL